VTRAPYLLAVLALSLLSIAMACGDDDSTMPQLGEGPAENVEGVWEGSYASANGPAGAYCLSLEQDGRAIEGTITFDGGQSAEIQGAIAEDQMNLIWGQMAAASYTPAALPTTISSSGSFSGKVSAGTLDGTYAITETGDHGMWSGHRSAETACE
jgi:hypothetical protein